MCTYGLAVAPKSVPNESDMLLKLSSWVGNDGIAGNLVPSVPNCNAIWSIFLSNSFIMRAEPVALDKDRVSLFPTPRRGGRSEVT
jgi:hypothetical protein